jgi:hypothetical protein
MPQCRATARNGERCRSWARTGSHYCYVHDPETKAAFKEAQRLGGRNSARIHRRAAKPETVPACGPPKTAQEAQEWSSWLVFALATGAISPVIGQKVSSALNTFLKAQSQAEMEREIRSLRAKIKELEGASK